MRTRSKTKRTRENLNRLPREVEATLPSWVKCTDPISAETLEEVRSTVLVWMKNVQNYVEENILNDGWSDHGWAFWVDVIYPYRKAYRKGETLLLDGARDAWVGSTAQYRRAWSTFIRQMLLSDVNIINPGEYGTGEDVAPFAQTSLDIPHPSPGRTRSSQPRPPSPRPSPGRPPHVPDQPRHSSSQPKPASGARLNPHHPRPVSRPRSSPRHAKVPL